ncbi:MAG: Lrp/AsnC family transcriptional regulator [Candidatus Micrarchaeia archaeon]
MKLDQLDVKIIEIIQRSDMLTPKLSKIAEVLGTTNATVYRRIDALKKEGVIIGHTTRIDGKLVGKGLQSFIYLKLQRNISKDEKEEIGKKLSEIESVESVYVPIGRWNYLIKVRSSGIEDLDHIIGEEISKLPLEEMEVEFISRTLKDGEPILPKR